MNDIRRAELRIVRSVIKQLSQEMRRITLDEYEARKGGTYEEHWEDADSLFEAGKHLAYANAYITRITGNPVRYDDKTHKFIPDAVLSVEDLDKIYSESEE